MNLRDRYSRLYNRKVALFVVRCSLALLLVALATALLNPFADMISSSTVALLYLLPVVMSSTLLGLTPGIITALAGFLAFNYYFTHPRYSLIVSQPQDILAMVVFLAVAVALGQLVGRNQTNLQEARSRERDVIHLYELMTTLATLRKPEAIARTSAERIQEIFRARLVEVVIQLDAQAVPQVFRAPPGVLDLRITPDQIVPLITPRGLVGEVHVWLRELMQPAEERLLQTFASQIALSFERVNMAQIETRASILEESDRLKSALLSSVSHDLRTPLATIKAAITSLRGGGVGWDTPAREELLRAVDEESDHLNRLVGNLLDMSRIESGALKPQRQWYVLADILSSTLDRMRHAAARHILDIDVSDELPLVPVDPLQIEQVFTNLISNALKYAPEGSRISIVAGKQNELYLLVRIFNAGPQLPEEHIDRIFDKFYRVTDADRITGTGLGLSICKGIIEAHHGRIWAKNEPGGLAFYFTLPLTLDGQYPPPLPQEAEVSG